MGTRDAPLNPPLVCRAENTHNKDLIKRFFKKKLNQKVLNGAAKALFFVHPREALKGDSAATF